MKLRGILIAALFPFLHATSYSADLVSCKTNEIVVESEDSQLTLSLFNVKVTDKKGWEYTCDLLEKADEIHFEIDPSTKVEDPLAVYLFADDQLVQEELIKQGYAYPMIHNPEYTYEKRLEIAFDSTQTMAKAKPEVVEKAKRYPLIGPLFLGFFILIWFIMLLIILRKRKKKQQEKAT